MLGNIIIIMSVHTRYTVNSKIFEEEDYMKDCPQGQFVPTIMGAVERIIVMGDVHGDLDVARKFFLTAKLIDANDRWIAIPQNTIVVQVGDQIDSCRQREQQLKKCIGDKAEDLKVMDFFDQIGDLARGVGGNVYSLLGNHELLNVEGNFNYVSYENMVGFDFEGNKGIEGRIKAFEPGGPLAKKLACNRIGVLIIGSTMFVHAGVLPALARRLDYLNLPDRDKLIYLNRVVRKWLLNRVDVDMDTKEIIVNDSKLSLFWTRIFGNVSQGEMLDSVSCRELKETLEVFKIGQVVVGHTPQLNSNFGINGTCQSNGKNHLYRVDGGFSRSFKDFNQGTQVQVLEILNDTEFNILTYKN